MKVLVIGGGGREHALCWKIAQSPKLSKLYCAPGNAGIEALAQCCEIAADDIPALLTFARDASIDLTVVGPEVPLVAGIVDEFQKAGLKIFGPTAAAAQIEGSKAFAKQFMQKYGVPSAVTYGVFKSYKDAAKALKETPFPLVAKASGLAAGKGVIICASREEANEAVKDILLERRFGEAGASVVLEEFLEGEEASILALTDGTDYFCLPASQDHKRLLDNDQGPNTGGMGAYAPTPVITPELQVQIEERLLKPALAGLRQEGTPFTGCLYLGVMITSQGPKILEFNCRFGDPEAQAVLPLYDGDLLEALLAATEGRIRSLPAANYAGACVCVVLASGGYPTEYQKGKPISGLDQMPSEDLIIFHAGTQRKNGSIVTDGGRVLGVTARARNLREAVNLAYVGASRVHFEGMNYRRDIARRALK